MNTEQKVLRLGAGVILLAVALRFFGGGFWKDLTLLKQEASLPSVLLYAATGKVYSFQNTPPPVTEPGDEEEPPAQAVFSPADISMISIRNTIGLKIDEESLLQKPLTWNLTGQQPTVLILHSHACESYENTEGYSPSSDYRTIDTRYNMVSVGAYLTELLTKAGISVIHDTTLHDYPSYNDAYALSRKTVQAYLEKYPSICLVLDLHRDAYEDGNGQQASSTVTANGKQTARLMFLTGTSAGHQAHPNWQENLSLALKLQATLEKKNPGLCRDLTLRSSVFNQDLSVGSLLVEVGTAGDTRQDALAAVECLAEAIIALSHGSK